MNLSQTIKSRFPVGLIFRFGTNLFDFRMTSWTHPIIQLKPNHTFMVIGYKDVAGGCWVITYSLTDQQKIDLADILLVELEDKIENLSDI